MIASLAQETKTAIGATLDSETSLQAVCTTQSAGITAFLNTSVRIPDHLEIEGTWNGICVCGHPVSENIQDMVFKCVYRNGSYSLVTPTYTPTVWQDTEGEQTVVFSYEEGGVVITASKSAYINKPKPVGGIIFYIDSTADGTYTFYNANGTQVSAPTVGTDCTGWTYEVTGASKDKYYVVYNELYTSKRWTYYSNGAYVYTSLGVTAKNIGAGKTNTATVMSADSGAYITSDSNGYPTVWYQIQQMRTNKVGGCDDWFVGSEYELDALRTSGAGSSATWFSGNYIWSSSEYSANFARYWNYNNSYWSSLRKGNYFCVCGVRAF